MAFYQLVSGILRCRHSRDPRAEKLPDLTISSAGIANTGYFLCPVIRIASRADKVAKVSAYGLAEFEAELKEKGLESRIHRNRT